MKSSSKLQQRMQLWWPAFAVLTVGSALSIELWSLLDARMVETAQERLEQQSMLFTSSLEQRLYAHGDLIQRIKPLLEAQSTPKLDVFASVKMVQETAHRYPGIESFSLVKRIDESSYAEYREQLLREVSEQWRVDESAMSPLLLTESSYYIVDEVWPLSAMRSLAGLDAEQQTAVKQHFARVVQIDQPLVSAPMTSLERTPAGTGLLISVPLRDVMSQDVTSVLSLSIRIEPMLAQFRARGMLSDTRVAIHDSTDANAQSNLIYASDGWVEGLAAGATRKHELPIWGRQWSLSFQPDGTMLSQVERALPLIIAGSTWGVTLLLAALVLLLSLQRVRAQLQTAAKHNLLRSRTDRLKALFHQSAIGVAEIDPHTGRCIGSNTRFSEVLGFSQETLEAMNVCDVMHADDHSKYLQLQQQLLDGGIAHFSITQRMVHAEGHIIWAELWVSPLLSVDGKPVGRLLVLLRDATEHRLMQEQLKERESYSSEMLRYMPVGLVVVGPLGNIEFVNHQFELVTGWAQSDISDESTMWRHLCVDAQQHAALLQCLNVGRCQVVPTGVNMPATEYLLRSKDGSELTMEVSGRFLGGRILLSFVDVSQRKAAEEEIRWLGFYDTLTQLPNRRLLLERLHEALARSQRSNSANGALLLLDIDNFKSLNETLGHKHGDALLRLVATRLSGCIAGRHTLARQGGDEFAVVLEDLPVDPLDAGRSTEQVGRSILEALRTPFYLGNQDFHVTVSMGAVVFYGKGDSVEDLLKHADLALYQAKSAGRDTLQFFDPSMQKAVSARVEMEKDMRLALERHEFDLFYQPQVQKDKVIGAEALLRWKHPLKGYISPSIFVPVAEESGLILPVGEWVLYAACRQLSQWAHDPVLAQMTMSVNVSPRQFYQADFVEQVQQALAVTGAKANRLELELTEGMLLTDVDETISKMVQLKSMGVCFSLDDFGTGYSSLSYLKRLPLDKLKIDQGFVHEVVTSVNDAAIARSIIALGNSLGLQVIAEGVETEAQRAFLADNGCSYWQGFYFSRPKPAAEFAQWAAVYDKRLNALSESSSTGDHVELRLGRSTL